VNNKISTKTPLELVLLNLELYTTSRLSNGSNSISDAN